MGEDVDGVVVVTFVVVVVEGIVVVVLVLVTVGAQPEHATGNSAATFTPACSRVGYAPVVKSH